MDTASFQFVLFGLAVALVSNVSQSPVWRSTILLFSSLLFLGLLAHNPVVLVPFAGFLLLGYAELALLERGWRQCSAWSIIGVILAFVWLKKYTFLPEGIFWPFPYFTLGVSYIFFRILHLLIEADEQASKSHIRLGAYLTYTLNFTTLMSGPIQRYEEFGRDQFAATPPQLGARVVGRQLERIIRGLFKVNVLALCCSMVQADALSLLVQPVPAQMRFWAACRLAVIYPFFLYANFSGYIDIVIALARLLRIRLPENFDRPFSATSFLDFWNRWHITLSTWLKTYVYNPLLMLMMRRTSSRTLQPLLGVVSFFVTFFLVGIWHGRTSEFASFGVLQGGGVALNKAWQLSLTRLMGKKRYRELSTNSFYEAVARGLTFTWFAFTLFWFWANWHQINTITHSIGIASWLSVWLLVWLGATASLAAWEYSRAWLLTIRIQQQPALTSRYALVVYATALGLAVFIMMASLDQPPPDIVYKAF